MIIERLHPIIRRYLAPAGEAGSIEDRGDDFTPTDGDTDDTATGATDDAAKEAAAAEAAAKKAAGDKKAAEGKKDGETDPDPDADPDADPNADKTGKKDTRMPLSRHKDILEKERAARAELERQLAQYQQGNRIAVISEELKKAEDQVMALDKEYAKLMTDGDHEKAAAKMQEIRKIEREIAEQKGDLKAQAASSRAVEKMRYDITVERLEAAYPVLNPEDDSHDAETAQDVMDLAETYRKRGATPAEAIQKAAKKLLGAETAKQTQATEVKARVDKDEAAALAEAETKKAAKEAERRQAQIKKNVDTSGKQPADLARVGADHDKAGGGIDGKSVMKMSYDDFAKLSEEDLSRMRGDTFAGA